MKPQQRLTGIVLLMVLLFSCFVSAGLSNKELVSKYDMPDSNGETDGVVNNVDLTLINDQAELLHHEILSKRVRLPALTHRATQADLSLPYT